MRILTGYLLLAFSVLLLLSLLSFNQSDSLLFVSSVSIPPSNVAGRLGVFLSSPLVLLYGRYASLLLDFGVFVAAVNVLVHSKIGKVLIKSTLFVISSFCLSVILALVIPAPAFTDAGILGLALTKSLREIFPSWMLITLFSILLSISLFSSMKIFFFITFGLARIFGTFLLAPFELFGLIVHKEDIGGRVPDEITHLESNFQAHESSPRHGSRPAEPEFLKSGRNGAGFHDMTGINAPENRPERIPVWLKTEEGKKGILTEIRKHYDEKLDDNPPVHQVPQVLIPELESDEREIIPEAIIAEPEIPLPDIPRLEPVSNESLETEINGEADYTEIKKNVKEDLLPEHAVPVPERDTNSTYLFPQTGILEKSFDNFSKLEETQEMEKVISVIENTFSSFKIDIKVNGFSRGPAITRYEIIPPVGLKIKSIVNLTDDLAVKLGNRNIRIVAPIGNKSIIGVEVPNKFKKNVTLRDIIESSEFAKSKAILPLVLGKDIAGNIVVEDLADMPHLLIAGTTGSGKSVYVNSLIGGIVYTRTAENVKFIFIDPKMVELELYNDIPHLLTPVITSPEEAISALEWVSGEMDRRYKVLSEFGVRNIVDYNRTAGEVLPYIVVVIDEFANLMLRLPKETEKIISRIAAMARAVGIHLVVATQRPSVDVVTGIIKANFPSRIAFRVSSQTDSRTILDKSGAEKLLGKGDMLFMTPNFTDMLRIQTPFVSNTDVENIVRELKRNGKADYQIDFEEIHNDSRDGRDDAMDADYRKDPVFVESLRAAVENGEVSASYLQRKFRIGYNRAARIIESMEKMKIIGPSSSAGKPREVFIKQEDIVNYI